MLDASAALSWCFEDESGPVGLRALNHVRDHGAIVPAIWPLEVLNSVIAGVRRERIDGEGIDRFQQILSQLPIEIELLSIEHCFNRILSISTGFGLTAYDASYLELAQRKNLALATRDKRLISAARAFGISVWA